MGARVTLIHLEFRVPGASSLKDKRRWVKGFKDRVSRRWNVSVAEVDALDDRHRAVLAVAVVANDGRYLQSVTGKIINAAAEHREMMLVHHETDWL